MMDWSKLRQQWQAEGVGASQSVPLEEVQRRDRSVRRRVKARDLIETVTAMLVAPAFVAIGWMLAGKGKWAAVGFCAFLVLWAAYVPIRLWQARRAMPSPNHELPMIDYLRQQRLAMIAQAEMLERIWIWYLAPCAVGVVGLSLSVSGPTRGVLIYSAIVLAFCALLGKANHYAARKQFRVHADHLETQIAGMTREETR